MKKTEAITTVETGSTPTAQPGKWRRALSFQNISAIYIFVVLFAIFAILTPRTFLTPGTWLVLLDAQSITVLAAVAVLIPLVTGAFNLAIGAEVGFAVILVAVLQVQLNVPWGLAVPITILAGALIGLVSGLLITRVKIDSFIATLGMSSVLLAGLSFLSENRQIIGLQDGFRQFATGGLSLSVENPNFKITNPVFIMLVISLVVWYLLERTPAGRRMYAAGYNPDGARLSGVNVDRLRIIALMSGGVIAGFAGVLLASRINAGDPTVGPGLLLPALTAVFLGSTQFKGGRFNVWGTVISVYVLAVGIKGLQLLGAQNWVSDLFNGVALLAAVGLSRWERTARRAGAVRRALPFSKSNKTDPPSDGPTDAQATPEKEMART
ncbi:sugar ABC transporter permease [Agromyces rhizosphaerae]|uniref:Autoinducer 2 import system permease protein LsrC n=1 Tax=Agromyces rhizosphaerae TaxID=88374 RepID=A0A9W6FN40_9MICO|nr:ABC transporter permease [Agromyces rhizosphaerae]GLI26564.1 sugar ABC transporter permease [Agromyces rhizosphaerae]